MIACSHAHLTDLRTRAAVYIRISQTSDATELLKRATTSSLHRAAVAVVLVKAQDLLGTEKCSQCYHCKTEHFCVLAVLNVEIDRQKLEILSKVLQNVEIICMTIDGFSQMQSRTKRYETEARANSNRASRVHWQRAF